MERRILLLYNDKASIFRSRINSTFGVFSLFIVISSIITIVGVILVLLGTALYSKGSITSQGYNDYTYYTSFILLQFLYPLFTLAAAFLIPVFTKCKASTVIRRDDIPFVFAILSVFVFLGLSTAASYFSNWLTELLTNAGISIPDMDSYIPEPNGVFQIIMLFVVMAVLPALCEELIFRGFALGTLSTLHPAAAIVLSSIAFGLMHATVQQIPFAFLIGLFLGYLCVAFNSVVLPIALHFLNNFISCLVMITGSLFDDAFAKEFYYWFDISLIVLGVIASVIFIILIRKNNKNPEKTRIGLPAKKIENGEALVSTLKSWAFWLFVVIYISDTIINILLYGLAM